MKIVNPYARMMAPPNFEGTSEDFTDEDGVALLRRVEWCARISHRSEEAQNGHSWQRFIKAVVIDHGDWSVVEHASVSVDIGHDRGFQQELTRHRIASYTIESTRFVNYTKGQSASYVYPRPDDDVIDQDWLQAITAADLGYQKLIAKGWRPQEARSVFPLALHSRIVVTENLRSWRHMFIMRTTKETHPQYRQISIPLLEKFKASIPLLFEDIIPLSRQVDNLKLPR